MKYEIAKRQNVHTHTVKLTSKAKQAQAKLKTGD
jgi:hypothetical protein